AKDVVHDSELPFARFRLANEITEAAGAIDGDGGRGRVFRQIVVENSAGAGRIGRPARIDARVIIQKHGVGAWRTHERACQITGILMKYSIISGDFSHFGTAFDGGDDENLAGKIKRAVGNRGGNRDALRDKVAVLIEA